jgi:hypothetical protein
MKRFLKFKGIIKRHFEKNINKLIITNKVIFDVIKF